MPCHHCSAAERCVRHQQGVEAVRSPPEAAAAGRRVYVALQRCRITRSVALPISDDIRSAPPFRDKAICKGPKRQLHRIYEELLQRKKYYLGRSLPPPPSPSENRECCCPPVSFCQLSRSIRMAGRGLTLILLSSFGGESSSVSILTGRNNIVGVGIPFLGTYDKLLSWSHLLTQVKSRYN
jgi:hypothetical protein